MFFRGLIATAADIETIRRIRNAGRMNMTGDVSEISPERQQRWWASVSELPPKDFVAVVYWSGDDAGSMCVGYGILSRRGDGRLYVSLAVDPTMRRTGAGRFIYEDLAMRANEPIYAEILKTNEPSIRAAIGAGFTQSGDSETTVFYRRQHKVRKERRG